MRTFTIGEKGTVAECDLIETMRGYATLFSTLWPGDAGKAYERFQQIHTQLREHGITNYTDELAEVVVRELEKIIDHPNIEAKLEQPFALLAQLGSSRATPFFLTVISKRGDDEELLFKREMAAERLVCLQDPTIPDELSKIAQGRGEYSRSSRRVAVWALAELDDQKAKETLLSLKGDDEVKDLIKIE